MNCKMNQMQKANEMKCSVCPVQMDIQFHPSLPHQEATDHPQQSSYMYCQFGLCLDRANIWKNVLVHYLFPTVDRLCVRSSQ